MGLRFNRSTTIIVPNSLMCYRISPSIKQKCPVTGAFQNIYQCCNFNTVAPNGGTRNFIV